jgi:hypothetical protein
LNNTTKRGGFRFSTSLIIGLLLVPLSAVAAVALVSPDAPAQAEAAVVTTVAEPTTTSTTVVQTTVGPQIASAEDLATACGDQGLSLVAKEGDGTITPLEQAALDSLRAICSDEGMDLPGKPAPDAVVETVTVAAAPASHGSSGSTTTTGAPEPTPTTTNSLAAQFEAEYASTVAYINAAIDAGAHGSMIDLATQLVSDAANLADSGDYQGGMAKLADARNAADQADRSAPSHEDDDDHHGDDDHGGEYDD